MISGGLRPIAWNLAAVAVFAAVYTSSLSHTAVVTMLYGPPPLRFS